MSTRKTSGNTQKGHLAVGFGMALALNLVMGMAVLHTPTQGQRYLAAMAAGDVPAVDMAVANCARRRV
jgi:hypothetical protein